ncbi:arsenic resistance N-acetyltransferase ArsN2 [Pseudomarimonas arenosa]|uniref:GNAT family N-acetyltransferase n=1 Tax=Pseudomarimonas arenosa TaxID=2774145 RepID=A0AAW3ZKP8_9GAMM|nr:arsenic resistance N-acetyltransferase ArsN2 [Pseudomarimonas arenosa]MBD8525632.1 GNAT family N-acetyltransferase [Pseudomarimonas arenosa]
MSRIRPAGARDRSAIRQLLHEAGLPTADLEHSAIDFWVIGEADRIIAAIGLETFQPSGLLRSLVVAPEQRGRGLGQALLAHLESTAQARQLNALYLLTLDADGFFQRLGYRSVPRHTAPAAILHSQEFHSLCPASALCMLKSLALTDRD